MVGVNMASQDAICECFEGTLLEPYLLKPCFHVAGLRAASRSLVAGGAKLSTTKYYNMTINIIIIMLLLLILLLSIVIISILPSGNPRSK